MKINFVLPSEAELWLSDQSGLGSRTLGKCITVTLFVYSEKNLAQLYIFKLFLKICFNLLVFTGVWLLYNIVLVSAAQ